MFSLERVIFESKDFKRIGINEEVRYVGHFSRDYFYGWGHFEYALYEMVDEPYYLILEDCSDNNDFDVHDISNYYISKISDDVGSKIAIKFGEFADKLFKNSQKPKKIVYKPDFLNEEEENIIMGNENLGRSLFDTLKEGTENFVKWTTLVTDMLKSSDGLKNNIEAINELDSALTDLKKISEETVRQIEGK